MNARAAGAGRPSTPSAPASLSGVALPALTLIAGAVLVVFLALPFLGLFARVSPAEALARLGDPQVLAALRLSFLTALATTALVVALGTPTAYLLATRDFPGKRIVEIVIELPMVLPPTVAGFALLMAFGRTSLVGSWLAPFGITLPFTTAAVVAAQAFMAAPFYVAPARAAFAGVDRRLIETAATLRASEAFRFLHVVLPLSLPSLLAGMALCTARALGEFGATITFAGNLQGVTQTMPLAVYIALQSDLDTAVVLSVLLVILSFLLLLGLRAAPRGWFGSGADARSAGPSQPR